LSKSRDRRDFTLDNAALNQWTNGSSSCRARRDQLSNVALAARFGIRRYTGAKESPGRAGAFKETSHESRDQGALDAPILSQITNQARRGSQRPLFWAINAQIAAPAFLGHNHRLSKK
jgi:hypothetical protein